MESGMLKGDLCVPTSTYSLRMKKRLKLPLKMQKDKMVEGTCLLTGSDHINKTLKKIRVKGYVE